MKITINNRTVFRFPTGLVVNRFTASIVRRRLKKEGIHVTGKQFLLCWKECKRYKKEHPDWNLIEVFSKDGNLVNITP